jgi:carbon-monoxide dehydrogenase medium subunit
MQAFEYLRPKSVDEAARALAGNANAKLLAGGQTLAADHEDAIEPAGVRLSISARSAVSTQIARKDNALVIGAMVTHADVATSAEVAAAIPGLAHLAESIGDPQVRNRGTIGGSLANNDPAADYPAAALALGATLKTNKRTIAADDYFRGLFATVDDDEIISAIAFPIPKRFGYAKFPNPASRFALVGVAVAETASGVRVAVTGAGANGAFPRAGDGSRAGKIVPAGLPERHTRRCVRARQRHPRRRGVPRASDRRNGETRGASGATLGG